VSNSDEICNENNILPPVFDLHLAGAFDDFADDMDLLAGLGEPASTLSWSERLRIIP